LAYRKLDDVTVDGVLRRWQRRESARLIARETGLDRKTVGRWIASAKSLALPRDRDLTEGELRAVLRGKRLRRAPSDEWRALRALHERIAKWLTEPRPLALRTVHLFLTRDHGVDVSYATLRRFAIRELGWRRIPSASPPAQGPRRSVRDRAALRVAGLAGPVHDELMSRMAVR